MSRFIHIQGRKALRFVMLMLLSLCMGFSCFLLVDAEEADDDIIVRVGYYENEVFQEGAQEGRIKTGYAYEYYQKISEYTGWKYEYVYGSFSDLYNQLLDGSIDVIAGLAYQKERDGLLLYPDSPMGSETYSLVKHSDADDITTNMSTLNGRTIGVLDSAMANVLRTFLNTHTVTANVRTYADYEALFQAFDEKQIDILAAEGDGASSRDGAEVLMAFGASDYYLCVSIQREDLLEQLNQAQSDLAQDEPSYLSTLQSRYYSRSVSSQAFSLVERT